MVDPSTVEKIEDEKWPCNYMVRGARGDSSLVLKMDELVWTCREGQMSGSKIRDANRRKRRERKNKRYMRLTEISGKCFGGYCIESVWTIMLREVIGPEPTY